MYFLFIYENRRKPVETDFRWGSGKRENDEGVNPT
jgi:hypothetical protein